MKFIDIFSVAKIRAAEYNPRKISADSFEKLQESLKTFGVVKPVIVNRNGIIVAGHQRTKAMKAVGISECPIFLSDKNVSLNDEIRFNLIHNSIEENDIKIKVLADVPEHHFTWVDTMDIEVLQTGNASVTKECSRLLNKYGHFGSVVVDHMGMVIENSQYIYSCMLLKLPCLVYKMAAEESERFKEFMKVEYGKYNYSTLDIKPYVQTYCQMERSDENKKSTLYEKYILPSITKSDRFLDFGAGRCFYAEKLLQRGYSGAYYEPFYRTKGSNRLNISKVIEFERIIQKDIEQNGMYSIVILDSVINSITSNDYQDAVLTTCNALVDDKGTFYMATRALKNINNTIKKDRAQRKFLEFLDDDNFTANFRKGVWTLQKFHSPETLRDLLQNYFYDVRIENENGTQLYGICRKPKRFDPEKYKVALETEFNIEYPDNYRHGKHKELVDTILRRLTNEN